MCVILLYKKKFSVKKKKIDLGEMVQTTPLFNEPDYIKNVTQITPTLSWVKLDKNDCINCALFLINWDDTSGFMVSLFENWINLYVVVGHFYIEATVIAI